MKNFIKKCMVSIKDLMRRCIVSTKNFVKKCMNRFLSYMKKPMTRMMSFIKKCISNCIHSIKKVIKNFIRNFLVSSKIIFQEKILKFAEGANFVICIFKKIPIIRNISADELFGKDKAKKRTKFGVIALIGTFALEFSKKFVYAFIFVYIPYRLLGKVVINVLNNQEKSIIYFFIIMTTLCGSITNNTVFSMSDRDYIMLRVMLVKSNFHYFGRILYKMLTELVYFTIILLIFGVSLKYSIAVSIFTITMRPLGEFLGLMVYDYAVKLHAMRGSINGLIMAAAFIVAYVLPYVNRNISDTLYKVSNPYFLMGIVLVCVATMWFLWTYKKYENVAQDAVYIRREDSI